MQMKFQRLVRLVYWRKNSHQLFEPRHEISNNVVCATSIASSQPAHTRSLIRAFVSHYSMSVKLLTERHVEFLSLKGGCTGSCKSTLVKKHIVGNTMSRLILNFIRLYSALR